MLTKKEDYELVQETLAGDENAFAELVLRYKNLVYSIILRMVNNSWESADLAQEVFIKIYKNLAKYQPEFKFSTWIIKIATNHVIDYRRKKKQELISLDDMIYDPPDYDTPEREYMDKEESLEINNALNSLPDMYRIPIVLYHKQGMAYQEIADAMGEPLSKVKNRIFRGRKMLKDYILASREGVKK
ncbi:MAG: sigma-70 family RNA polymerase sigma factor [Lachnospiraceae bacterium]|nr:sigma-70 family RNA polymerase sigma factor [Lachnospiraceae bacterium]